MGYRIEDKRPIECKSPYVLGVIEVTGIAPTCWEHVVERRKWRDFIVDGNAIVGHLFGGFTPWE